MSTSRCQANANYPYLTERVLLGGNSEEKLQVGIFETNPQAKSRLEYTKAPNNSPNLLGRVGNSLKKKKSARIMNWATANQETQQLTFLGNLHGI